MEKCPLCGSPEFLDYSGRPTAVCKGCGAMERHRCLAAVFQSLPEAMSPGNCLEIAPLNPKVYGAFLKQRGWKCLGVDKWRKGNPADPREVGFIDQQVDVVNMKVFRDGQFHLIIMQHVIEEVPEYRQGFAEIARVLHPVGVALLEIPYNKHLQQTQAAPQNRYGNLWAFGADLPDIIRDYLPRVEVVPMQLGAYAGDLFVCRHG